MKVEIISGNEAGIVKDLPQVEAECAIQTGFAKPHVEPSITEETFTENQSLPSGAGLDAHAAEDAARAANAGDEKPKEEGLLSKIGHALGIGDN
jgi:hypothetical protein